jgi:hypothetical protein
VYIHYKNVLTSVLRLQKAVQNIWPHFLVVYNQNQSIQKYLRHKCFTNVIMFHSTLLKHISFSFNSNTERCDTDKVSHYSTHTHTHTHLTTFIAPVSVQFQYQRYYTHYVSTLLRDTHLLKLCFTLFNCFQFLIITGYYIYYSHSKIL